MRRIALGLVTLVAATGLTACSVPVNGLTGLSVDAQGRLLAQVVVCSDDPPDVVRLSGGGAATGPSPRAAAGGQIDVAYKAPPDVGRTISFRLDGSDEGWPARPRPPELVPDVEYRLYGRTHDNSHVTADVVFRLSDRTGLLRGWY